MQALRIRPFLNFIISRFAFTLALMIQGMTVSWQVYESTHDKLALGLIGLSEAIPFLLLAPYSGYMADHMSRRTLLVRATFLSLAVALGLCGISYYDPMLVITGAFPVFVLVGLSGLARALVSPAGNAIQSELVPRAMYANAATWASVGWQIGAVLGPLIGGLILQHAGPWVPYAVTGVLMLVNILLLQSLPKLAPPKNGPKEPFFVSIKEGIHFVFSRRILVGSLTLDLLAVLFGSVTALLPAFTREVLFVGPLGLGFLRAAPFMGSALMGMFNAYYPPTKRAGRNLLLCVAGYGFCMLFFALSKDFWLSAMLLFVSGGFDNVSMVIRSTLVQLMTPNHMRGRVSAVNSLFVKSSNEIGDFESGLAARLLGMIPAVIFGSMVTLGTVAVTAIAAPSLRTLDLQAVADVIPEEKERGV